MKYKQWSMKEIKYIIDNHEHMTVKQMAKKLGRKESSVRHQVYRQKLKSKQEWEVLEYAYYVGDELVCIGKIDEIEKFTGISSKNLLMYRYKCFEDRLNRKLISI